MLTLTSLSGPDAKNNLIEDFDLHTQTWIVSDLRSKKEFQKKLIQDHGFIAEECLLRASELWRWILKRSHPEWRLVSAEYIKVRLNQHLADSEYAWAKSPGAAASAFNNMGQLFPFFVNDHGPHLVKEWFKQNDQSFSRWGHWFLEGYRLWQKIGQEKILPVQWVPGLLTQLGEDITKYWDRPLRIDLAGELTGVEVELLSHLSSQLDVEVLMPAEPWFDKYGPIGEVYQLFETKAKSIETKNLEAKSSLKGKIQQGRYTTMLSEVKEAVSKVRHWLDEGIHAEKIAVIAPDIEIYWPVLNAYFEQEGIPVNKDVLAPLQSFSDIAYWTSRLRVEAGKVASHDLEMSLYSRENEVGDYDHFRRLYSKIYTEDDVGRWKKVAHFLEKKDVDRKDRLLADEFIAWSMKYWWNQDEASRLEQVYRTLLQDVGLYTKLELSQWLDLMEQTIARIEIRVGEPSNHVGVTAVSINSAENAGAEYLFVLGMTDSALRQSRKMCVPLADVGRIQRDIGFYIESPESSRAEFALKWILGQSRNEIVLSFPVTDFDGKIQAPSILWLDRVLKSGDDPEQVHLPDLTRWDEMQQTHLKTIANLRNWSSARLDKIKNTMAEDLGEKESQPWGEVEIKKLSATAIERYLKCPFIYVSEQLFGLSDLPVLDMDIDRMTSGKLLHAFLEKLTVEPMNFDLNVEQIEQILDQCRKDEDLLLADKRLWPSIKNTYIELGRRFLAFEKSWRQERPKSKIIGREIEIKGFLQPNGEFSLEKGERGIPFRGFIDRVEGDEEGKCVIIDYKSGKGSHTQYTSWLKNNQLQLALYTEAIEKGMSQDLGEKTVYGSFYYIPKQLDRSLGFRLDKEDAHDVIDMNQKTRNKLGEEQKTQFLGEVKEKVQDVINRMHSGQLSPNPNDKKDCDNCTWGVLCRAPHLL